MDPAGDKLLVRQYERVMCRFDAEVEPAGATRSQVSLSRQVGDGKGRVRAQVTDCSGGGIGLRCPVFFPKHALVNVRVTDGGKAVIFEGQLRVQRAVMVGREPAYDLGGAFTEASGTLGAKLGPLMQRAREQATGSETSQEPGRA